MDQQELNLNEDESSLSAHIKHALETMLANYQDSKKGIRILSKKMGIHDKTLQRILNQKNKPNYQTIFKIYRVYFNEFNDAKILNLVPSEVKEYLVKNNAQELKEEKNYTSDADRELQRNPITAEIYIIAATGPLYTEHIQDRFGKYGVELLEKMVRSGLLNEVHKDVYVLGPNQPNFNGDTIVSVGSTMINNHAKPDNGEELDKNFISFFAEGLSEEAYLKWLSIDQEAFKKKFELSRDPKNLGKIRAFTFMISETIQLKELH